MAGMRQHSGQDGLEATYKLIRLLQPIKDTSRMPIIKYALATPYYICFIANLPIISNSF